MKFWRNTAKLIDFSAEIMGWIGCFLVLYCMIFGVTGVFMRYVLNSPSLWIASTLQAAMVLMACTGGIYAFKHGMFVKLDLFYANFSPKKKAVCDVITSVYTFLFLGVLIWQGTLEAHHSIVFNQVTPTAIPIPIYPIKTFIPIAGVFVLLLVIKQFVMDIRTIAGRE